MRERRSLTAGEVGPPPRKGGQLHRVGAPAGAQAALGCGIRVDCGAARFAAAAAPTGKGRRLVVVGAPAGAQAVLGCGIRVACGAARFAAAAAPTGKHRRLVLVGAPAGANGVRGFGSGGEVRPRWQGLRCGQGCGGLQAGGLYGLAERGEHLGQAGRREGQRRGVEQARLPHGAHPQPRGTQRGELVLLLGRRDRLAHHRVRAHGARERRQHLAWRAVQLQQRAAAHAQGRIQVVQRRLQEGTPMGPAAGEAPTRRCVGGGVVAIDRQQARGGRARLRQREVVTHAQVVAKPEDHHIRPHRYSPASRPRPRLSPRHATARPLAQRPGLPRSRRQRSEQ